MTTRVQALRFEQLCGFQQLKAPMRDVISVLQEEYIKGTLTSSLCGLTLSHTGPIEDRTKSLKASCLLVCLLKLGVITHNSGMKVLRQKPTRGSHFVPIATVITICCWVYAGGTSVCNIDFKKGLFCIRVAIPFQVYRCKCMIISIQQGVSLQYSIH